MRGKMDDKTVDSEGALGNEKIKNDLLIRSLNFHGQQLTSLIKDEPIFRKLDLKNVDYQLYQARYSELKMDERGYRLDLHRFIASNIQQIFKTAKDTPNITFDTEETINASTTTEESVKKHNDLPISNSKNENLSANMPAYETFAVHQL